MSTLPLHPIEYLKLHLYSGKEGIWVKQDVSLGSIFIKVFDLAEKVATVSVVLLVVALTMFAFMQIIEAGAFTSYYCDTCKTLPKMLAAP